MIQLIDKGGNAHKMWTSDLALEAAENLRIFATSSSKCQYDSRKEDYNYLKWMVR